MPSAAGTPYAYDALFFSGNTYDVNNTSGNAISINKNNLSDPTTYTGSAVTFLGTSVTTLVHVVDMETGNHVIGANVLIPVASGVNFPYNVTVTIASSGTTATVTHASHGMVTGNKVIISGVVEDPYNGCFSITYIGVNSYSYTMKSSTSSPATGTIKCTMALISGCTNISGEISDTRSLVAHQPVTGWVRRATYAPSFTSGAWDDTALTLTKTGAFAGQPTSFVLTITGGTNMTTGEYIATYSSDNAVTLVGTAGSANSSDVAFTIGAIKCYKQQPISDTVDKDYGKTINIQLVPDE